VIPGVPAARGLVGPPLTAWASRAFIAGQLPNRPEHLVRWIQNPQAVEPRTAMPDLGVSLADAQDIAAYLYTLR
jgi:cytochrome c1